MLLKRSSFAHEEELRIFLQRDGDNEKCKSTYDVPVNWSKVIDKIYLAEDCTDIEMQLFLNMCKNCGIDEKLVSRQSIYGKTSSKQIVFSK